MKNKQLIITFSIIIILLLGAYFFAKSKKLEIIYQDNLQVEINSELYNDTLIKEIKNGKLLSERNLIDTSSVGKKEITIKIQNFFHSTKEITYEIEIIDPIAPSIVFQNELTTEEGTEIDLLEGVIAKDNSGQIIEVEIEGEYNFNEPAIYELYYVAKDSSGNETKEKFTLEVTKKPEPKKEEKEVKQEETKKEETKQEEKVEEKQEIAKTITNEDGTFTTSKGFNGYTKNGITYIDGILVANKTYSLPESYNPGTLTSETTTAMNEMFAAANLDGIYPYMQSGFRSYSTQNYIYNSYASRDGYAAADRYSARPGHSEHQTGLAFDVCHSGYGCINSTFDGTPPAIWLANNAYKYGFILRYPKGKENETGYMYESWHFRYVGKELAAKLYNNGDWITLETYFGITSVYNS